MPATRIMDSFLTRSPPTPAAEAHYQPMVETRGIVKRFPGIIANDNVDLDVGQGSIHAILGENGAGKSTLMHILSGLYQPDEGDIRLEGQPVAFASPLAAINAGVGMVHQHFMLVETASVAENVVLGDQGLAFHLNRARIRARVQELGEESGLELDPDAYIWQLSVGEQQRVEIVKMLYRGARLLILDEPTAVLTPQESLQLFGHLRHMAQAGKTVLFISHKLDEVLDLAHWITVMRDGRVVGHLRPQDTTKEELVRLMVGRPVLFDFAPRTAPADPVRLELRQVQVRNDRGALAIQDVSLDVRQGEILGLAGVAGNGQRELAEAVTGLRSLARGTVQVDGRDLTGSNPRRYIEGGVAYVPQDRQRTGSAPNLSLLDNLALKDYRTAQPGWILERKQQMQKSRALLAAYEVVAASERSPARLLSGGNLQKLILARELSRRCRVLIAESPTRGLDIGAIEKVHEILLRQKEEGLAILLLSEDLDEIMALSDRVAVIYHGRIMGLMAAAAADINHIGFMMAGVQPETGAQP